MTLPPISSLVAYQTVPLMNLLSMVATRLVGGAVEVGSRDEGGGLIRRNMRRQGRGGGVLGWFVKMLMILSTHWERERKTCVNWVGGGLECKIGG